MCRGAGGRARCACWSSCDEWSSSGGRTPCRTTALKPGLAGPGRPRKSRWSIRGALRQYADEAPRTGRGDPLTRSVPGIVGEVAQRRDASPSWKRTRRAVHGEKSKKMASPGCISAARMSKASRSASMSGSSSEVPSGNSLGSCRRGRCAASRTLVERRRARAHQQAGPESAGSRRSCASGRRRCGYGWSWCHRVLLCRPPLTRQVVVEQAHLGSVEGSCTTSGARERQGQRSDLGDVLPAAGKSSTKRPGSSTPLAICASMLGASGTAAMPALATSTSSGKARSARTRTPSRR